MTRKILLVLALCCLVSGASAATLDGVTLPDSYVVDGQALPLNGIGVRLYSIFRVRIYVAGLYLVRPSHDSVQILHSSEPKVVRMKFVHGGSREQVQDHYREGEDNECRSGGCDPSDGPDFERLVAAVPAVQPGDTTTFVFVGKGFRVLSNDRLIIQITNPDLAYHMLDGFIGEHPPSKQLRDGLLGLPQD